MPSRMRKNFKPRKYDRKGAITSTMLAKRLNGFQIRNLHTDPMPFNRNPYFPIVVNKSLTTQQIGDEILITPQVIIGWLCNQLGIQDAADAIKQRISFKLKSVKVFAGFDVLNATSGLPAVFLDIAARSPQVEDTTTTAATVKEVGYPTIMKLQDIGSLDRQAAVGYVFPSATQSTPYIFGPDVPVIACAANRNSYVVRLNMMWSFNAPAEPI